MSSSKVRPAGPGYATARVCEVLRLSPSLIRVVFDGVAEQDLASSGVPDEIVHLYFPAAGEDAPPSMTVVDGVLGHHGDDAGRECRNYTVRRWDGDRVFIDFVDHGAGVAASWARAARPGQMLGMWGTRAWYSPPAGVEWMLLVADLPGLPALLRIVEELPADRRAHAIVEVRHRDDMLPVESAAEVTVDWRIGGNGHAPSVLAPAVAEFAVPNPQGYVWFAGEASVGRALRKQLKGVMPPNRLALVGYWRDDKESWLDRYELESDRLLAEYERFTAAATGMSEAEAELHWDEILERAGL